VVGVNFNRAKISTKTNLDAKGMQKFARDTYFANDLIGNSDPNDVG
jgi:hypothetical protein